MRTVAVIGAGQMGSGIAQTIAQFGMNVLLSDVDLARAEAGKALGELKAKGMQINELSPTEANRMRSQLTRVNATIATNVGMDLWKEAQAAVAKARTGK